MTPKQYRLFIFIKNRIIHFGKAPTFSEMKKYMDVTANQTISDWLYILVREGYISRNKGKLRGLDITEKGTRGFDDKIQLQEQEALKTIFNPEYNNATSRYHTFNTPLGLMDMGIIDINNNIIPKWKGGEKDGSS